MVPSQENIVLYKWTCRTGFSGERLKVPWAFCSFKSILLKNSSKEYNQFWCKTSLGEGESFFYKRRCWPPRGQRTSVCQLYPLKVYYSRTAQQNVTKFGVKYHWRKRNQFCINESDGLPVIIGAGPSRRKVVYLLKTTTQERLNRILLNFMLSVPGGCGINFV